MSYIFKDKNGKTLPVIQNATLIPAGYMPIVPGSYKIKMGDSKSLNVSFATIQANQPVTGAYKNFLVSVSAPASNYTPPPPPPPAPVNYSTGANYKTPTGTIIYLSKDVIIPNGWVVYTGGEQLFKFTNGTDVVYAGVNDGIIIPVGFFPVDAGSFQIKDWDRSGMSSTIYTIPTDSTTVQQDRATLIGYTPQPSVSINVSPSQTVMTPEEVVIGETSELTGADPYKKYADTNIIIGDTTIGEATDVFGNNIAGKTNTGDPTIFTNYDPDSIYANTGGKPLLPASTINWTTVGKVIAVIGAAGVAYVGYLYITSPKGFRDYAEKLHELTGIVIDFGYMLIILSIVAGISFIAYEFFNAYNQTGSVVGALAQLTAATIETLVSAIVDAIEVLAKDAWNFAWGEVKDVVPSWL